MKKQILASVFCFIALANGYSQTKQESIKELFHLMQTDSMMEKTFAAVIPTMMNQMPMENKDSASMARMSKMMSTVMASAKEMSKRLLNEDMVVLYDKYFTENEIKDFIIFYKTPSGQKMLTSMPEMQKEIMTIMMQKYMPEMMKSMKATMEELKNKEKK